jgi:hypothetical protein
MGGVESAGMSPDIVLAIIGGLLNLDCTCWPSSATFAKGVVVLRVVYGAGTVTLG